MKFNYHLIILIAIFLSICITTISSKKLSSHYHKNNKIKIKTNSNSKYASELKRISKMSEEELLDGEEQEEDDDDDDDFFSGLIDTDDDEEVANIDNEDSHDYNYILKEGFDNLKNSNNIFTN